MYSRREFVLLSAAGLVAGCDTTTGAASLQNASVPPSLGEEAKQEMRVVEVDVKFTPVATGFLSASEEYHFRLAGLTKDEVTKIVDQIYTNYFVAANPTGKIKTRAEVSINLVWVANEMYRREMPAMDSAINTTIKFVEIDSNAQIGDIFNDVNTATFNAIFGGRAPLPPKDELALVANQAARMAVVRNY